MNEAGLMRGRNVLVMAPTSSGKTMIGELAALRATQQGGRSVFLLLTKALVNEQQDKFARTYGPAGVRTIRATGDYADQVTPLLRGQFDIAVLTYEMFTRLALANPHLLRIISVVVIDEVQTVVDPGRGPLLELLLTLMKSRKEAGVAPGRAFGDRRGQHLPAAAARRPQPGHADHRGAAHRRAGRHPADREHQGRRDRDQDVCVGTHAATGRARCY